MRFPKDPNGRALHYILHLNTSFNLLKEMLMVPEAIRANALLINKETRFVNVSDFCYYVIRMPIIGVT